MFLPACGENAASIGGVRGGAAGSGVRCGRRQANAGITSGGEAFERREVGGAEAQGHVVDAGVSSRRRSAISSSGDADEAGTAVGRDPDSGE